MTAQKIKDALSSAVDKVCMRREEFVYDSVRDFTRCRKLSMNDILSYLVTQGSQTTDAELADFTGSRDEPPCQAALSRQRAKLKPEGVETLLHEVGKDLDEPPALLAGYIPLAADGTKVSFPSDKRYAESEYYTVHEQQQHTKGVYMMQLSALQNLSNGRFVDGVIQPIHEANELRAFCAMCDRNQPDAGQKLLYIADRGTLSWNTITHAAENGQFFLMRSKDVNSHGSLLAGLGLPEEGPFDVDITVEVVRSRSSKVLTGEAPTRYITKKTQFDFLEYGSYDTFRISFRAVGFLLPNGDRECLITNLSRDEFGIDDLKVVYGWRWGEESSYRELKYTIGALEFHSPRPVLVKQEIWAAMVRYNLTVSMICDTVEEKSRSDQDCLIETRDVAIPDSPTSGSVATEAADRLQVEKDPKTCRHVYRIKFTKAAEVTRKFLLPNSQTSPKGLLVQLLRYLEAVRPGRKEPRHMATRRRTRHFLYRAA